MQTVTKELALEVAMRVEEAYYSCNIIEQSLFVSAIPLDTVVKSFQLLMDDGTLCRMTSVRTNDRLYFQNFARYLVHLGFCHWKEKQ